MQKEKCQTKWLIFLQQCFLLVFLLVYKKSDCLLQFRRKLFDLEYNVLFHEKQKYSKSIIERSQAVPLAEAIFGPIATSSISFESSVASASAAAVTVASVTASAAPAAIPGLSAVEAIDDSSFFSPTDRKSKKKAGPKKKDPAKYVEFKDSWFPKSWMVFIMLGPVSPNPHIFWNGMRNSSGPSANTELDSGSNGTNGTNKRKLTGRNDQRKSMRDSRRDISNEVIELGDSEDERDNYINAIRSANKEIVKGNDLLREQNEIESKKGEFERLKFLYTISVDPIE